MSIKEEWFYTIPFYFLSIVVFNQLFDMEFYTM